MLRVLEWSMRFFSTGVVLGQHHPASNLQNSNFYILGDGNPEVGPLTLKFELIQSSYIFLTMQLPTKFHHPTFNRSEVIA